MDHPIPVLDAAVAEAEQRAAAFMALPQEARAAFGALDDLRTAVAGDIADALDKVQPNLGWRFMQAMHPELVLPSPGEIDADVEAGQLMARMSTSVGNGA